jgi:hypothetical protein
MPLSAPGVRGETMLQYKVDVKISRFIYALAREPGIALRRLAPEPEGVCTWLAASRIRFAGLRPPLTQPTT